MDSNSNAPHSARDSNLLTILVFKDGFASRTFQIPKGWFSRFGLVVGILAAATTVMALFAVRSYYAAHRASPARVESLESELSDLKASYRLLEARTSEKTSLTAPQAASQANPKTAQTTAPMTAAAPEPVPTVTVTVTPQPTAPVTIQRAAKALLFSALPSETQPPPADASQIPIEVHSPRAHWHGTKLIVQFDLQYIRQDKGNQQGRIVILARGPGTMLAYPENALNPSSRDTLITPQRGEYFSVSRFRAVRAEFSPPRTSSGADAITETEVLIFDGNENLLIHTRIEPSSRTASEESSPDSTSSNNSSNSDNSDDSGTEGSAQPAAPVAAPPAADTPAKPQSEAPPTAPEGTSP